MAGTSVQPVSHAQNPASRPRLVALTGYGQETDYERSRAAGFDRHLVKPVRELDLLEELNALAAARVAG